MYDGFVKANNADGNNINNKLLAGIDCFLCCDFARL